MCLDAFGSIRQRSQAFGSVWKRSDVFGKFCSTLSKVFDFLGTCSDLFGPVRMHSEGKAELVLLSMPPPPKDEPAANYMQYLDALLDGLPPTLVVRGYRRSVATIYQ